MPIYNKICKFCGTSYYYCNSCNDTRDPQIYNMFDSPKCKNAFNILTNEYYKRISTADAKNKLIELGFTNNSSSSEHFKSVMNYTTHDIIQKSVMEETVMEKATEGILENIAEEINESSNIFMDEENIEPIEESFDNMGQIEEKDTYPKMRKKNKK